MNKVSRLQARLRESGKVGADAGAEGEWAWELQTESYPTGKQVGFVAREALSSPRVLR